MQEEKPTHAQVKEQVLQLKEAMGQQDTAKIQARMKEITSAQSVVDFVAPLLFQNSSSTNTDDVTAEEALSMVSCLVHCDSSTYLKPVSRAVKHEALRRASSEMPMHVSSELLSVMISQLSTTDVETSSNAAEALVACCRKLGPLVSDPALQSITDTWKKTWEDMAQNRNTASTICVRCASSMVDLTAMSDQIMEQAQSCGATDMLLQMLTCETDPLLAMSVLDLLERMASLQPMHASRARFLCSNAVLEPLLTMAGGNEGEDPDPILGGSALRVLSAICRLGQRDSDLFGDGEHQQVLQGFQKSLNNFKNSGELDRLALVDAISSFAAASPEALEMVLSDPTTREAWLLLSVAQPKLKAVILTSVAMVIDPAPEKDANGDPVVVTTTTTANLPSSNLAMKLYTAVGDINNSLDSTELLLEMAKSPIPETRLAAYALFRAVAHRIHTGSQVLLAHSNFYEFLISREAETTKEGKEAKYAIVQAVYNSPAKGLLANDIVKTLERILKQGPFHVEPHRPELMTE